MIRPLFLTLILSSAFFTSPAAGQGSVETVTGNYGYTQYRYSGGNAQVIDASNATFVQQNRDGLNPYPFRVSNARPGLVISGGTIAGEVSQTEAWRPLYNRGNSTGMLIENVPNVVISNWRIDGAWDAIRPRGSDNFVIENTRITNVRDDAVENDDGTNGTIRNSIFDGVFVGISLADEGTPSSARNNLVTLDNVAIRMQNFLYDHNGPPRMTHQSPFKVTDRSPRLLVNNSIIAIQNPNHAGFSRLQTAWNKMIGGSGNVYLNLSDTPLPSNYPRPPSSGWTVLQGQEARDYWQENVGTAVNSTPIGGGPVAAFVPQISDTQGQDILTDLLQTQNFDDAVEGLASVSDLSIPEAEELLNSIIEIPDLNLSSGGQLLDGFIEGRLDVSELGTIVDTLDGIQETLNDPEILNTLIGNIGSGIIPPELAEAISLVDELGQLGSIDDLADILAIPDIAEEIREIFNNSIFSNPLAALEAVSALTEIFVDPAEFIGQSIDEITEQVLGALEGAIPDVFQGLLQLAGGDPAALIGELAAQLIGNFDLGGFDIAPGETGEYEIFDREPHSSPVSQSCRTLCALPCTCERVIQQNHINIRAHKTDEFIRHRTWMVDVFFREHIHYAMKLMTVQLSAVAMRQVFIIGKMFDAKHQQETQRLFQQLMAEAHRDYYPSEGLCEIGTNTRALAGSEDKTNIAQLAFANRMQDRAQRSADSLSGADENADRVSRILRFQEIYCNRGDNANGLSWLCAPTDTPRDRRNKDINFSQTVLSELTLEADYINNDPADDPDGEDVFALTTNLFSDELMPNMERTRLATPQGLPRMESMKYMDLRSILAKRSVAENAFASIVAERVSGMDAIDYSFMRRILVDLGVPEDEINEFLGEYPSYYAQRKILTDYVFENPVFYTELYESHANVLRKDTAIKALNLMLEDDMFDRQLESEAVLAVILETMLAEEHTRISRQITDLEPGDY